MNGETSREPTDQEILDILAEECAEVIHIISKIRRFGIDEVYPKLGVSNRDRLLDEYLDLTSMCNWALERGIIPPISLQKYDTSLQDKKIKVRKYCAYGDTTR